LKYDNPTKNAIDDLASRGFSGRGIAAALNLSKSGVNEYLKRSQKGNDCTQKENGPKILVLDVETAAAVALAFGRFKVNLSQDHILKEGGYILCASWRWLDSAVTENVSLTPEEVLDGDDSRIVEKIVELLDEADAIVAHNGLSFDHKVVQTRATANGFPKLPTVKVLDTLLLAKRYLRLPSNRLDSIGEYFGLGRKIDTGGIKLWAGVQSGDEQAMQDMVSYCDQDVDLLHSIYLRLRHLGTAGNAFNSALYYTDDKVRCTVCGSDDVEATGRVTHTSVNSYEEYFCNDCGALHRSRKPLTDAAKRKSLLATVN
jgi:hypothetical protein